MYGRFVEEDVTIQPGCFGTGLEVSNCSNIVSI